MRALLGVLGVLRDQLTDHVDDVVRAVTVEQTHEGLQGLVLVGLGILADLVPVLEPAQFRVLGPAAGLEVLRGLSDQVDVGAAADHGDPLACVQTFEDGPDRADVGLRQDGVGLVHHADRGVQGQVALQFQVGAQEPQVAVADGCNLRAEAPALGEGEHDVRGPVLEGVDRPAEAVDRLLAVADDNSLRRLVLDDALQDGVDVLRLVEKDHAVGQTWPGQRPHLDVVVALEDDLVAVGVRDVPPGLAGGIQEAGRSGRPAPRAQVLRPEVFLRALAVAADRLHGDLRDVLRVDLSPGELEGPRDP